MPNITDILTGEKPIEVAVKVDNKIVIIFGIVMFVVIVTAYYTVKSFSNITKV